MCVCVFVCVCGGGGRGGDREHGMCVVCGCGLWVVCFYVFMCVRVGVVCEWMCGSVIHTHTHTHTNINM
jgi:hypothetical protein